MPLRLGEMVLIIRTQDFASRNLDRVSANLGKLSKFQQLQRRQAQLGLREARAIERIGNFSRDLSLLQRRVDLETKLANVTKDRHLAAKRLSSLEARQVGPGVIRGPTGRFQSIAPQLTSARSALTGLKAAEADLMTQHEQLLKRLNATAPALAKLGSDASARRVKRMTAELGFMRTGLQHIQSDLAGVNSAMNQIHWERLHRAGQTVSRLGRVMQLTGLIAAGSFVAAGNAAANFEQQVTLAATQARDIGAPIAQVAKRSKQLETAILGQMQRFPASADDMAQAAYKIFSSLDLADKGRFKFWKGLQVLEKANKVAVAGGVDLTETMNGLVIVLNNFDPNLKNVNGTLDTMFDIVRFGNLTVADFTTLITRVAATAKGVGHTLEDLAAPIAFLSRVLPSERVGTGLFRLEEVFANRDFQAGFKIISKARLGRAFDFAKSGGGLKPFQTILENIVKTFPELENGKLDVAEFLKMVSSAGKTARMGRPSEGQLFTSQARNVLRPLVQNMDQLRELQLLIAGNKGEFNAAFAAMKDTPAIQWKIFLNQLRAVALEIGRDALPALLSIAGAIKGAIAWWRGLDDHTKNLIIRIGVFAGVLTLVGGIVLSVVGGIISLVGAIALLSGGLGAAGAGGVIGRIVILLGLLRALTLIGAIVISVNIITNWIKPKLPGWAQRLLSYSGTDAAKDLLGMFGVGGGAGGGNKGLVFNADAKLNLSKDSRKMMKQLSDVRNTSEFDKITAGATKKVKDELEALNGMTLADLRKQFAATGEDANQMAQVVDQAGQQAAQSVDQAAQRMTQIWEQFRQENETAFGQLFSGPFFQSETWSLAEEWDVKPTMREINRDLTEQIQKFRKWRSTLSSISKRKGVSPALMKELQGLGPDALDKLEVLRKAAPGAFNSFIRLWRTKQKEINRATKIDFDAQLKQWYSYGKGIAKNIILGLQSENVALDAAFKKYILSKYPNIVSEARADARREYKRQQNLTKEKSGSTTTNSTTNTTNITVHPTKGESNKDAARRAAHTFKHGGKGGYDKGGGGFGG
jgi:TP901 family phage tail tape measure protein